MVINLIQKNKAGSRVRQRWYGGVGEGRCLKTGLVREGLTKVRTKQSERVSQECSAGRAVSAKALRQEPSHPVGRVARKGPVTRHSEGRVWNFLCVKWKDPGGIMCWGETLSDLPFKITSWLLGEE